MGYKFEKSELSDKLREDIVFNSDKILKPADVEIHGRTLVNLLGRAGNAIYKQDKWSKVDDVIPTLEYSDKFILNDVGKEMYYYSSLTARDVVGDKYYIAIAKFKNLNSVTNNKFIPFYVNNVIQVVSRYSKLDWDSGISIFVFKMSGVQENMNSPLLVFGTPYAQGMSDTDTTTISLWDMRLYEIGEDDYTKNESLSAVEIDKIFPYVDDIKCVINPYIESKENLLEGLQWGYYSSNDNGVVPGGENDNFPHVGFNRFIPCEPNTTYTLSNPFSKERACLVGRLNNLKPDYSIFGSSWTDKGGESKTITTGPNTAYLAVHFMNSNNGECLKLLRSGKARPTLVKGSEPKLYEGCHNSRIMFETKLYEDEIVTRRNDGTYIKNSVWWSVDILENLQFSIAASYDKAKSIFINGLDKNFGDYPNTSAQKLETALKLVSYDGTIIQRKEVIEKIEQTFSTNRPEGTMWIVLPNNLTGWGPNFIPTQEEIKAFFLGWKMFDNRAGHHTPYNITDGTGHFRGWAKLWCGIGVNNNGVISTSGTSNLPITLNDSGYTPYKLIYKKSTPNIEEVKTHGSLVIKDGLDVSVSSGLILGEINRTLIRNTAGDTFMNVKDAPSNLKYRLDKALRLRLDLKEYSFICGDAISDLEHTIHIGRGYIQLTEKHVDALLSVDYLISEWDTVSSFQYRIMAPYSVKEALDKIIDEISNTNEKISVEDIELRNRIKNLPQVSNPNLLINGDFQVWQRGTQFSGELSNHYTADRWTTSVFGSITGVPYSSIIKSHEKGMYVEITRDIGQNQIIEQRFENIMVQKLKGNYVTLSCKYSDLSLGEIAIGLNVNGSYARYISKKVSGIEGILTFTTKLPDNLTSFKPFILIQSEKGTKAIIEWIKLELSECVTPFSHRPYAEELALCQRYYQVGCAAFNASTTVLVGVGYYLGITNYPVEMRTVPTVSIKNHMGVIGKMFVVTRPNFGLAPDVFQGQVWERVIQFNSKTTKFENGQEITAGIPLATYYQLDAEIY